MSTILRRVICLLTAIILAVSGTGGVSFADETDAVPNRDLELLRALEVFKGTGLSDLADDDEVTRARFATAVVKFLGLRTLEEYAFAPLFTDVPVEYWASSAIRTVTLLGVMNGYGAEFLPDNGITLDEAVKTLVCAFGYGEPANHSGGYPTGYQLTARRIGLVKGRDSYETGRISWGSALLLFANALTVQLYQQSSFGNDTVYYTKTGGTALSDIHHIDKRYGLVTGSRELYWRTEDERLQDGEVSIDGRTYLSGRTNAAEFVGYNVIYYVRNDEDETVQTLAYICENTGKTPTVTVFSEDMTSGADAGGRYTYFNERGSEASVKLAPNLTVAYNGRRKVNYTRDDLRPKNGEVTFHDTGNTGVYDLAVVYDYTDAVVDSVNVFQHTVMFKYGAQIGGKGFLKLDKDDIDSCFSLKKDGRRVGLEELNEWNILSVAAGGDGKIFTVAVSDRVIQGTVSEVEYTDDGFRIAVGGSLYNVSPEYWAYKNGINAGESGTFYLNRYNAVCASEAADSAGFTYGCLIDFIRSENISGTLKFKIYSENNELKTLDGEDKIIADDGTGLLTRSMDADSLSAFLAGRAMPVLVKYKLSGNGKVREMCLPYSAEGAAAPIDKNIRSFSLDDVYYSSILTSQAIDGNLETYAGQNYVFNKDTRVFAVPKTASLAEGYDINPQYLKYTNNNYQKAEVYDSGPDNAAKALVVYLSFDPVIPGVKQTVYRDGYNERLAIITKCTQALVDGETQYKLYGAFDTALDKFWFVQYKDSVKITSYNERLQLELEDITPGDVVVIRSDFKNNVSSIRRMFTPGEDMQGQYFQYKWTNITAENPPVDIEMVSGNSKYYYAGSNSMYAFAGIRRADVSNNYFVINSSASPSGGVEMPEWNQIIKVNATTRYYIYNQTAKTAEAAKLTDLLPNDSAFMRVQYAVAKEVFIIRP